ncbi:Immunity protein 7 [Paenibacillus uliginis N3/975]|uniref:Immunity protein 7 n=1 Tax=Paenibacillus uliginis N3/975 TaxID=1313296 RepID=A0A1X7HQ34_9BACL|nr:Imm7 family immunity protein [Paenibacillus uliginis]SMF90177.1 Immunity protein 7 [Paenibacillus uliginis N3/975]
MYEYHGWATIRESSSFEDDDEKYSLIVQEIRKYFDGLEWPSGVLDLRAVNGDYQVWIAGLNNHKPVTKHNPIEVLRKVGELAPGSYGVLYVRDSDDAELFNEFKIYTLIRGEIMDHNDPFLSPFIPKIEDDYED